MVQGAEPPGPFQIRGSASTPRGASAAALLFALLHASSFSTEAWPLALGQQIYAFVLGVLYAYWLEKSGSIVASVIGHNVSDVVEYAILFLWVGLASA